MHKVYAPFTVEQVDCLNSYQQEGNFHPFTCSNRGDEAHSEMDPEGDWGVLIATEQGWICRHCDYTQNWAWDTMVDYPKKVIDFIQFFGGVR